MSRKDILEKCPCGYIIGVKGTPTDFVSYRMDYGARCVGPRIFWQKGEKSYLMFSKNKFYGSMTPELLSQALRAFHIDWVPGGDGSSKDLFWVRRLLRTDKYLWSLVFSGKVTNPEDLVRRFSKKYFGGVLSYRAAKIYFKRPSGYLQQMYNYSTNLNLFIEKTAVPDPYEYDWDSKEAVIKNLLLDTLKYAEIENRRINPAWDEAMLKFVHSAQIARDIKNTADSYPSELITSPFKKDGLELILSERDCFVEGVTMKNCVHRCYWEQVCNGDYLLAKGNVNGEYINFGIRVRRPYNDNRLALTVDQVHTYDNNCPSQATMDFCENWMLNNRDELKVIAGVCKMKKQPQLQPTKEEVFDIPF